VNHTNNYHWTIIISSALCCPITSPSIVPCEWSSPDGSYFNLKKLTTQTGTIVYGAQSDVYDINVCGIALGDGPSGVCAQNNASVCFQYEWAPNW
jgi:hypothetical protein